MGSVFKGLFGGGSKSTPNMGGAKTNSAAGSKLFSPEQVAQATKDYTSTGTAKWNQIMANMGAGGGTGEDFTGAIADQAKTLGGKLSELTDSSGYGNDGMSQLQQIMRSLEGDIGAKYSVY